MRDAEQTRQKILDISADEIHKKGFTATSLSCILKRCEISKGALYHHFANKIELDGFNEPESIIFQYIKNIGYVVVYGHMTLEACKRAGLIHVEATRVDFDEPEEAVEYAKELHKKSTQASTSKKPAPVDESTETEEQYIERRSRDYAKQIGDQLRLAGFESEQIKYVLSLVEV